MRYSWNCIRRLCKPILLVTAWLPISLSSGSLSLCYRQWPWNTALCSFAVSHCLLVISAPLWHWLWLQCWFVPAGEALEKGKSLQLSAGKEGTSVMGKEQSKGGAWTRGSSVGFMGAPQGFSLLSQPVCVSQQYSPALGLEMDACCYDVGVTSVTTPPSSTSLWFASASLWSWKDTPVGRSWSCNVRNSSVFPVLK